MTAQTTAAQEIEQGWRVIRNGKKEKKKREKKKRNIIDLMIGQKARNVCAVSQCFLAKLNESKVSTAQHGVNEVQFSKNSLK